MKIAMFGGSFDPIHNGHVSLAHAFVDTLCLEKVLIIPTHYPPHKQKKTTVTPQQRLDMCRLAFEGEELFEVSDIEIKREGKSYTYMTLEELSIIYPDDELYLITGADMFMTIDQWKEPEIIFRHAVICGVPRDDDDISVRINNLSNFYYWCASRVLTLDRVYAKEVLNAIGATQAATELRY